MAMQFCSRCVLIVTDERLYSMTYYRVAYTTIWIMFIELHKKFENKIHKKKNEILLTLKIAWTEYVLLNRFLIRIVDQEFNFLVLFIISHNTYIVDHLIPFRFISRSCKQRYRLINCFDASFINLPWVTRRLPVSEKYEWHIYMLREQ